MSDTSYFSFDSKISGRHVHCTILLFSKFVNFFKWTTRKKEFSTVFVQTYILTWALCVPGDRKFPSKWRYVIALVIQIKSYHCTKPKYRDEKGVERGGTTQYQGKNKKCGGYIYRTTTLTLRIWNHIGFPREQKYKYEYRLFVMGELWFLKWRGGGHFFHVVRSNGMKMISNKFSYFAFHIELIQNWWDTISNMVGYMSIFFRFLVSLWWVI